MARKQRASSVPDGRRKESAKHIDDRDIDFSDIPESTPEELKRAARIHLPATTNAPQNREELK